MSDLISKRELYKKLGDAYNDGLITWGENEIVKDIIGECLSFGDNEKIEEGQLKMIRDFIVNYIMRDSYVMYSDVRDVGPHHIDLIYVIASLYEELHKQVTGEPYEYMFHWANKVGSWVEDDLFNETKFKQFLEELKGDEKE